MPGYTLTKADYLRRLRLIEGQVRGLERMIDEDRYCIDVLTQITAVTNALRSMSLGLLDGHVRHCIASVAVDADPSQTDEAVAAAVQAFERLSRN